MLLLFWSVACASGILADDEACAAQVISPVPGSPAAYVDPFIGASTNMDRAGTYHGLGKTFPGAATPFGMVQVSPNTVTGGDNGSGYSHEHTTIEGFALTQMSGVGWYGDLGNFLMMPTLGKFHPVAGRDDGRIAGYRSHYDKGSETAHPGYYRVRLTDYDITVETSATPRCGFLRFTFPESDSARIQVDLARRVGGTSTRQYVKVINDSTLAGWMHCTPDGGGWGAGAGKVEYAYADGCVSRLALALGNDSLASEFECRSQAYRNVFDPNVGWFRPRKADGTWEPWNTDASPLTREGYGCIESNLYQQGWFVPHDPEGMARLMGGRSVAVAALDTLFSKTPSDMKWNAYYNHANEPVHFVPYIYNRLGAPWLTQLHTRDICRSAYGVGVEGLVGNEDVGQMSAWYVLSASGIHPSCPGESRLEITSPVFDEVEYSLDGRYHRGGKFRIVAHDNSPENIYIDHALLNGRPYEKCNIDFSEISAGGVLELFMSPTPGLHWGTD